MKTITLKNGLSWQYDSAIETEEFYNGASRRTLTVTSQVEAVDMQTLYDALTAENLGRITMVNDDAAAPAANVYDGYVLPLAFGANSMLVSAETPDSPAVYARMLQLKLGRRTYVEQQLTRLGV